MRNKYRNMKKYQIKGGGTIEAASNSEAVEQLRLDSKFGKCENALMYMNHFSQRYLIESSKTIRCFDKDHFIEDLIKYGFLTEV